MGLMPTGRRYDDAMVPRTAAAFEKVGGSEEAVGIAERGLPKGLIGAPASPIEGRSPRHVPIV